ncbi:Arsenical resistance operon repressor [Minicystis rosea]|nr:Arsenical resistance operon repressor [Minicystis rosea]
MAKALPKVIEPADASCCTPRAKLHPRATKPYVRLFKALGDETRLEMLGLLASAGTELCVCDIESHFELSQPTISHHLKLLREAGLVTSERRGTWVYYALDKNTLRLLPEFHALLGA